MTCIVGIVDKNRVVIGSDSLASTDDYGRERLDKKVFAQGDYIFGVCGSYRAAQILKYNVDYPKFLPKYVIGKPILKGGKLADNGMPVKSGVLNIKGRRIQVLDPNEHNKLEAIHAFFVREIVPKIRMAFETHNFDPKLEDNYFSVLVGIDKYIIEIEDDFEVGVYNDWASAGSGIHYATSSLHTVEMMNSAGLAKNITADDKLTLALSTSSAYVSSVGGTLYAIDTINKTPYIL